MGIILPGESKYYSSIILIVNSNREPRPCIDYRKLNQVIRTEYFPLPNIEEWVEEIAPAKYITLLDLSRGYWQIPLSPKAQKLAAFISHFGSYIPLRMSFGLKKVCLFLQQNNGKNSKKLRKNLLSRISLMSLHFRQTGMNI